jgi:beta-galactosidase
MCSRLLLQRFMLPVLLAASFTIPPSLSAHGLDSVRTVVKAMGYDLPRLSAVPDSLPGSESPVRSLDGIWQFSADTSQTATPRSIEVPGEWVMQGFAVAPGRFAVYQRTFTIPAGWIYDRIKLRCDAIFSECEIYVNGKKAGGHLGGFTPFETDITECVQPGSNNALRINVRSESIADSLASASQYAVHPLGGISRKIYLMALPPLNCSMLHVSTDFDGKYADAMLNVEVELSNESLQDASAHLLFELTQCNNPAIILKKEIAIDGPVKAASFISKNISLDVKNPQQWDTEHPNLYSLKMSVVTGGNVTEMVHRTFGFKQIEVRGNQLFVNNRPIKLRGVCRHEVMPLRGRSLSPGQWEEDVRIFREANVNYIRTSHYPPAPEFIEACDRLGMFVEVEGPYCWAHQTKVPDNLRYRALVQPDLEMVNTFRSNPSVLIWSIGNESEYYKEYFSSVATLMKWLDPAHPRNVSFGRPDGDNEELEVGNYHYPGPTGPQKCADAKRPIVFDEYCHLNAYNRFELVTDPGIRDAWGIGFEWMWDKMYYSKGTLGGALWAGIDDSFFLPDGRAVGYGTWGPIDGWRRPKPEYWHVKKVYSPVKIRQISNRDPEKGVLLLGIENRMQFSNLSECRFSWKANGSLGTFAASASPGETTLVPIAIPSVETVYVEVTDPRGFVMDQYEFTAVPRIVEATEIGPARSLRTENKTEIRISSGKTTLVIDKIHHSLKGIQVNGETMISGDAALMVLPLNGSGNGAQMTGDAATFKPFTAPCTHRSVQSLEVRSNGDGYDVRISDRSDEARGYTEYTVGQSGIQVRYSYEIQRNINPRQVGLVFNLPGRFQQLEWERNGQWNFYPEDQIGRLKGKAAARNTNPLSGPAGPATKPAGAYASDQNELGTNDFRSTKMNIRSASLSHGSEKVSVVSDGTQSVRCWLENGATRMLVAAYSNMGAEGFFRPHAEQIDRPLKPGDTISGTVNVSFSR